MSHSMPFPMLVHLVSASAALLLGAWQLIAARRGLRHRSVGYAWMFAMLVASASSFWLKGSFGLAWLAGFSPIHGLSLFTLLSIVMAARFARRRDFQRHRRWVVGAYAGLVAAGAFAVALPGRSLNLILSAELSRLFATATAAQF